MTTGNREDYLINILRLTEGEGITKTTELATFMKVSPASVSEMLKILAAEKLVEYEKYKGVKLTEEGLNYARQIRRKHHVLENFLVDVLNIDSETAHEEACRIEHTLSNESAIKMCQMLGTPADCDCQSCSEPCKAVSSLGVNITAALSDLSPGEKGTISHLKNDDPQVIRKLISMGFVPGRKLSTDEGSSGDGVRIVTIDDSVVVLDPKLTSSVYIDTCE